MQKSLKGRRTALLAGFVLLCLALAILYSYRGELRAWYEFYQQFESLGKNDQGYPEYRHLATGIVFVSLPGGTFQMGSSSDEPGRTEWDEGPVHPVRLSPFLIAKYELSNEQWNAVMEQNRSVTKEENFPVDRLTREECEEFCQQTGLSLPTEAQWEYACRAGTRTPFAYGEKITNDQANYNSQGLAPVNASSRLVSKPVDTLQPNGFGLHHMHGNVWEWCADAYDREFYGKPEALQPDPLCKKDTDVGVMRGGDMTCPIGGIRSARRHDVSQSRRSFGFGFRPAWSSQRD